MTGGRVNFPDDIATFSLEFLREFFYAPAGFDTHTIEAVRCHRWHPEAPVAKYVVDHWQDLDLKIKIANMAYRANLLDPDKAEQIARIQHRLRQPIPVAKGKPGHALARDAIRRWKYEAGRQTGKSTREALRAAVYVETEIEAGRKPVVYIVAEFKARYDLQEKRVLLIIDLADVPPVPDFNPNKPFIRRARDSGGVEFGVYDPFVIAD